MFERFTRSAKQVVFEAAGMTRELLVEEFATARRRGGLSDAEAEALGELGIDVSAIVDRIEREHGENALAVGPRRRSRFPLSHIPFADKAKVLVDALRQAKERNERQIGDEHILLALAAGTGVAAEILAAHGLSYPEVRARLAKAS